MDFFFTFFPQLFGWVLAQVPSFLSRKSFCTAGCFVVQNFSQFFLVFWLGKNNGGKKN